MPNDDIRFANMCKWLGENGMKLHTKNTGRSSKVRPYLVMTDSKTGAVLSHGSS